MSQHPKGRGKEEHMPELPKRDYHGVSSDNSLSRFKKRKKNDENLQGEFLKIKSPTYEGEMNTRERD